MMVSTAVAVVVTLSTAHARRARRAGPGPRQARWSGVQPSAYHEYSIMVTIMITIVVINNIMN